MENPLKLCIHCSRQGMVVLEGSLQKINASMNEKKVDSINGKDNDM